VPNILEEDHPHSWVPPSNPLAKWGLKDDFSKKNDDANEVLICDFYVFCVRYTSDKSERPMGHN